ncbi:MAG: tetratricopeptide repeat protein [Desulfuromonadaceae bacterium]|nr:tetratricopeptide repeat protein [Desulfuromonadaceae bacterium]MDD2853903.1 tetratricopeptide repeat protein [Desulfuromonadaceae bacterium]
MADLLTSTESDIFSIMAQDSSAQRKQIAQYAIMQAATYLQNSQNDDAIKAFKKAVAIDAQNATAYDYLGKIYLSQGKNSEAIKAYQQLVRIQSNQTLVDTSESAPTAVDAHISLANAYLQDKQYAASEKEFKIASKMSPNDPLPDYSLGLQYSNTGRLAEAEAQFLKSQKIAPKDGNVYYALGMVYNKQGRYEEAATALEKALTIKKDFSAANYELGVAYDALGKSEEAQKQLSILKNKSAAQTTDLMFILNKPAINSMNTKKSGGFIDLLGPGTPLWMLDPSLLSAPESSKTFSVSFSFSTSMDLASVINTQNWSISRANSTDGGFYNNTMPLSSKEAALPNHPEAVFYNSLTGEATIKFSLRQNKDGDATIDPSHIVFKFSGKDSLGRAMDVNANEIDGYSIAAF